MVSTHVSLEEKSATIVHDPRAVSVARLAEVIEDAGFDATPRAASGAADASAAGKAVKARASRTVSFGTGVGTGGVVTRDFDINYMVRACARVLSVECFSIAFFISNVCYLRSSSP